MKSIHDESNAYHRRNPGERGHALVFAACTLFAIITSIMLIFSSGKTLTKKIVLVNAGDAASYSGALTLSNSLNTLAAINREMLEVYANMETTYQQLDEAMPQIDRSSPRWKQWLSWAGWRLRDLWRRIRGDMEQIEDVDVPRLKELAEMEKRIIEATPGLVMEEVYRVAVANGAEAVAVYPPLTLYFKEMDYPPLPSDGGAPPSEAAEPRNIFEKVILKIHSLFERIRTRILDDFVPAMEEFEISFTIFGRRITFRPFAWLAGLLKRLLQRQVEVISPENLPRPLVLTDSFFDYGIAVGVWKSNDRDSGTSFSSPTFGYFAFSCSKPGFIDSNGHMQAGFRDAAEMQMWLESDQNLFSSAWSARLVGVREAFPSDDRGSSEKLLRRLSLMEWRKDPTAPADASINDMLVEVWKQWIEN